jgi:hypothetical protein
MAFGVSRRVASRVAHEIGAFLRQQGLEEPKS